jgi:hypothetical protein
VETPRSIKQTRFDPSLMAATAFDTLLGNTPVSMNGSLMKNVDATAGGLPEDNWDDIAPTPGFPLLSPNSALQSPNNNNNNNNNMTMAMSASHLSMAAENVSIANGK